ncbi:hypothetical protein AGOR_G00089230 [Albula goreensis]|uniref:HPt domain-containing protein n=1 Tax=Albula goreensis TaxID=1534307 RepID=A0A8T3DKJ1_9TELE|nr:hypothetical protein AGOR_G00089230 [Albula goreensis]
MMDPFDTQFLLILAPVLLIVVLFLSFWLLTREASYDEALARHRRQVGLSFTTPAATSRKGDRKKSKKKDCGVVGGGERYGGDSDSELRALELMDAVATSVEELSAALETPSPADTPPALRNRRKKKPQQPTAEDPASTCKSQSPLPFSKLPSPPPAEPVNRKKESERKQRNEADDLQLDTRVDQDPVPVAKNTLETMETKPNKGPTSQDTHTSPIRGGKRRSSSKKQKAEPVLVDEPLIQATVYIPLMDRDAGAPTHSHSEPTSPTKTNHRKQKKEPNKENSWMKLEEVLSCLRRLPLATEEVSSVVAVLSESCPSGLEAWLKSKVDSHPWAQQLQERENQLTMLKREVSVTQGNVKQLRQELQTEKQKTGRVEALHQERCGVLEQELSTLRAQTQSGQQGAQATQTKLQQLEEKASQLENENGILRDAVSRASKQRESEQAAELSRLRLEHTASLQELAEKSTKLQQEEGQRKTLEAQLQDAKSRWEEVQSFLHNANTEKEKLQAVKQELQAQLLLAESEMNSKNQEIQSLHSNLTDTMVSKDQLEQKVLMLMESTQCGRSEDTRQIQDLLTENKSLHVQMEALQSQVASQASRLTHFEELQRLLAEKEMQRKSLEDSLNVERSISAGRESDMQSMHTENLRLKAALQRLQAQLSEQAASQLVLDQFQKSVQEKDEKIRRTVEDLLEASLAKIAEKEEELKVQEEEVKRLREESVTLKQEVEALGSTEQAPMQATVEDLLKTVEEKEGRLEAELQIRSAQEETIKALEQQVEALGAELEQRGLREAEELQELQARLSAREKRCSP